MHRALLIQEIISQILDHVDDDVGLGEGSVESNTLCGLARLCKAWSDPALDVIWAHISEFEVLLKVIPAYKYIKNGYPVSDSNFTTKTLLSEPCVLVLFPRT